MNEPKENLIADAVVDAVRKHLPYGAVDNVYWGAMWQEIRREARSHISAELAALREENARLSGIVSSQAKEIRALGEALSGMTSLVSGTGFTDSPEFDRAMAAFEFIGTSAGESILPNAPILADARRWWMLPAFLEEFQIDYVGLKRAIDAELFGQYCSATPAAERESVPEAAHDLTLRDFGYAPGNYMIRCSTCHMDISYQAKQSWNCMECAQKAMEAAAPKEPK